MNLCKKWIDEPYEKYTGFFKIGILLILGSIFGFILLNVLKLSVESFGWIGIVLGYSSFLGFFICVIAEVQSVKQYTLHHSDRYQQYLSKKKKIPTPPALRLLLILSVLFGGFVVFNNAMNVFFFDSYGYEKLRLFRYSSQLGIGLFVFITVIGIIKRYRWSWYAAIGMSITPMILIGSEIALIYIGYHLLPNTFSVLYSYFPIMVPSLIFLYYFTRSYMKEYLFKSERISDTESLQV